LQTIFGLASGQLTLAKGPFTRTLRVVVLGGTGFVGKALAEHWPDNLGERPTFLVHRSRPAWLETENVRCDAAKLCDYDDMRRTLAGCDVLINLLRPDGTGWYPEALRRLTPVFHSSGINRCVHVSSIDVYAGTKVAFVDKDTLSHPLTAYESEHLAAEQILATAFPETVVLRLGAVFGAGGRNLVSLAEEMRKAPVWKLALRRALYGDRRMHLVSVETACDAIVRAALHKGLHNSKVILVTEDADPDNNFAFVQDRLAEVIGRALPAGIPTLPRFILRLALKARGLPIGAIDRRFSAEEARALGVEYGHFAKRVESYARLLAGGTGGADGTDLS